MTGIDSFTENDLRYFQSIEEKLACSCGSALWAIKHNQLTNRYEIKCLTCKKYLALRELYNVNFPIKISVNTDPRSDYPCPAGHNALDCIQHNITLIQNTLSTIQDILIKEGIKA